MWPREATLGNAKNFWVGTASFHDLVVVTGNWYVEKWKNYVLCFELITRAYSLFSSLKVELCVFESA